MTQDRSSAPTAPDAMPEGDRRRRERRGFFYLGVVATTAVIAAVSLLGALLPAPAEGAVPAGLMTVAVVAGLLLVAVIGLARYIVLGNRRARARRAAEGR